VAGDNGGERRDPRAGTGNGRNPPGVEKGEGGRRRGRRREQAQAGKRTG